jgi:membrane-associated PAP2 superfamily phosphatase
MHCQSIIEIKHMNQNTTSCNRALLVEFSAALAFLVFATLVIEAAGVDAYLADFFYEMEDNQWRLKNAWVTSVLIHKGGKNISILFLIIAISLWVASYKFSSFNTWKYPLHYLMVASLLGVLLVGAGKALGNVSCPWDFSRYGGSLEYISLLEQLWVRNGRHCFPAGHASSGFAWVSLYFFGRHFHSIWRWSGLVLALCLGVIFGVSQQLRGAHFISHDLWSFGTCWMASLICYYKLLKPYEITIK